MTASASMNLLGLDFHHVGVACRNLDREEERFAMLGYLREGEDFHDPIQGVRGRFLVGGGPRMELLIPDADGGVLEPWLKSGRKLYHLAYETPDIRNSCEMFAKSGSKIIVPPVSAAAFGGRQICFLMMPNMLMVELVAKVRT